MPHKLNSSFTDSMEQFRKESLRSKYRVTVSYLQFLYNRHADLELLIISHIFLSKVRLYQSFIESQFPEITAESFCDQITIFLENRGYPASFIDHKKSSNPVEFEK